jgi:hypothetical protein
VNPSVNADPILTDRDAGEEARIAGTGSIVFWSRGTSHLQCAGLCPLASLDKLSSPDARSTRRKPHGSQSILQRSTTILADDVTARQRKV